LPEKHHVSKDLAHLYIRTMIVRQSHKTDINKQI